MSAPTDDLSLDGRPPLTAALLPALQRLDALLQGAVARARSTYGTEPGSDRFRGLYVSGEQVEQMIAREPGASALYVAADSDGESAATSADGAFPWLARTFSLSPFDVDVILIALAPEIDLRYERVYGYLQDDVTRRRPTVDLVLALLCPTATAKLAHRRHFDADAPLLAHDLVRVVPDPHQVEPPLLAHYVVLDEQIVEILLGHATLDRRLATFCALLESPESPSETGGPARDDTRALHALAARARVTGRPLRLYFEGPSGGDARRVAAGMARAAGMRLLTVDLRRASAAPIGLEQTIPLLFREASVHGALLYIEHADELRREKPDDGDLLLLSMARAPGIVVLSGTHRWMPGGRDALGVLTVPFPIPDFDERRACWETSLSSIGVQPDDETVGFLADRFRLVSEQIADAVVTAASRARWRCAASPSDAEASDDAKPSREDLLAAARAQSGHELAGLAQKVEPVYTWDDIVLPDDVAVQLHEICQRVQYRQRVLQEWGFGRKLSGGKGVTVLFAGPSGTGKTMAAEVIAHELGLDLFKVDLSGVVSKYIGETEKNLDRIFGAAEASDAILLFDEADALFGKRSEVRDAHDRYANIEISYLLQKMEQYAGITILATNLRANFDTAFIRRLTFTVHLPFPSEADRARIWERIWPADVPRSADLDVDLLARRFKLAGGNIRNAALAAAFLAAADGGAVRSEHLQLAIAREMQKFGKVVGDERPPISGVAR